jgi:hypothetical protein
MDGDDRQRHVLWSGSLTRWAPPGAVNAVTALAGNEDSMVSEAEGTLRPRGRCEV